MYAKIIDGQLVAAPRKIPLGDKVIYNPTPENLTAAGYKPVVETDPPEVDEWHIAVPHYTEKKSQIVQSWTVEDAPDDIDEAEAFDIIFGGGET